jgi:hypothetical protein
MADKPNGDNIESNANWRDVLSQNPWVSTILGGFPSVSRSQLASYMGQTFGGARNHYQIFGWPVNPTFNDYYWLYRRGGLARRVVNAYPFATWRSHPSIVESGKTTQDETQFEAAWDELVKARKVFHYLERVDKMARLGNYAVLFLGYADVGSMEELIQPVQAMPAGTKPQDKLLYIQPYTQGSLTVSNLNGDYTSQRFGMPENYTIQIDTSAVISMLGTGSGFSHSVTVHWTRVLHVAEDIFDNDLVGFPALEPVLNFLLDLEKVCGSAAESWFQNTPPATIFKRDPDAVQDQTDTEVRTVIEDFIHRYKRYAVVQGLDTETLQANITGDPSKIVDMILDLIAGTTGIPKRILVGSERGELASTQDETAWNQRVTERQQNWAEPFLLRPFIDEMIAKGVLPVPVNGYEVQWSSSEALSEDKVADIAVKRADALTKYANTPAAEEIMPPDVFLEAVMGFDQEVIDRIKDTRQELWDKDLEEMMNPPEPVEPVQVLPPPEDLVE